MRLNATLLIRLGQWEHRLFVALNKTGKHDMLIDGESVRDLIDLLHESQMFDDHVPNDDSMGDYVKI